MRDVGFLCLVFEFRQNGVYRRVKKEVNLVGILELVWDVSGFVEFCGGV